MTNKEFTRYYRSLAAQLKAARQDTGTKQKDLADTLGIEPGTLSAWESDTYRPSLHKFFSWTKALNVDFLEP